MMSLFSGVGGLDAGFLSQDYQLVAAIDSNADACWTYYANHGAVPICDQVSELDPMEYRGLDLVLAGPPCQGVTTIGKRDPKDPRNNGIIETASFLAASRPSAFLVENVVGLITADKGRLLSRFLRILQTAGLTASVVRIDCVRLGLPQRRRRLLIVGGRGSVGKRFVSNVQELAILSLPPVTVADALLPVPAHGSVANHTIGAKLSELERQIAMHIKPGQKFCDTRLASTSVHSWDLPHLYGKTSAEERLALEAIVKLRRVVTGRRMREIGDGRAVTLTALGKKTGWELERVARICGGLVGKGYLVRAKSRSFDLTRKFNGRFRRLSVGGASPAVIADFGNARAVLHPVEDRALTVRECARLQGFEDSFVFYGSRSAQFRAVANAFPPKISDYIALAARRAFT